MATTLTQLTASIRVILQETTAKLWTDANIVEELNHGISDLWRAVNSQYQDYHFTTDITNCSIVAGASTVTGVPSDVCVIRGVEPRVPATYPFLEFQFKPYNSPQFMQARKVTAQDPSQLDVLLVAITGAAGPVGAPTIHCAPILTTTINLRVTYVPNLAAKVAADNNPIPGQSDKALICYAVAYLRARIREDQAPDPDWLALYATEKQNLLTALAPRQEQDDEFADAVFQDEW